MTMTDNQEKILIEIEGKLNTIISLLIKIAKKPKPR